MRFLACFSVLAAAANAAPQNWSFAQNPDPQNAARFGDAVVLVDVDRDGALDLVVGAPSGPRGRVYGFRGPIAPGADLQTADLELHSPDPVAGDHFGDSFAVGDLDGDGRDELVIGAPHWTEGSGDPPGIVFLFDPDEASPWRTLKSALSRPTHRMGFSLAVGDFQDIPGLEVAAAAPGFRFQPGGPQMGAVHVFSQVLQDPREWLVPNPNPCACGHDPQFGHRVIAGDWDGDGRTDMAVSAIFNDVHVPALNLTWPGAGQVLVYRSPDMHRPFATLDNPDPDTDPFPAPGVPCVYQRFGNRIRFADAVAQDGFEEISIGAHRKNLAGVCEVGRAYLYTGRAGDPHPRPLIEQAPETPSEDELFGYGMLFADVLGDGRQEWIVGALPRLEPAYIAVYDGALLQHGGSAGPPTVEIQAPPGSGAHFLEGMIAGRLGPVPAPPAPDRDELVLGDPDHQGFRGRVAILSW